MIGIPQSGYPALVDVILIRKRQSTQRLHKFSFWAGNRQWSDSRHFCLHCAYDDYIGLASGSSLEYHVIAVALDNAEGPPSGTVQVTLADRTVPGQPTISSISGEGGKVTLAFAPAVPEERTMQFLVLRSGSAKDIGVVLGDPLLVASRQYQDLYVRPGETYFYRLVAVDAAGNRSDPTEPLIVRVGYPEIPKPVAPYSRV